jgi:hypothetical protein
VEGGEGVAKMLDGAAMLLVVGGNEGGPAFCEPLGVAELEVVLSLPELSPPLLLLWELLCRVPPTVPPTPPTIRIMMMTIAVIPHLVRYHRAFFATRPPFSGSCPIAKEV